MKSTQACQGRSEGKLHSNDRARSARTGLRLPPLLQALLARVGAAEMLPLSLALGASAMSLPAHAATLPCPAVGTTTLTGTYTNTTTCSVGGTMYNYGTVVNSDTINLSGSFYNGTSTDYSSSVLDNSATSATINDSGHLYNWGTFENGGTVTVSGTLTFESTGTLEEYIYGTSSFGVISGTSNVTLGGTLDLVPISFSFTQGETFDIIKTTLKLSSTFATIDPIGGGLYAEVFYNVQSTQCGSGEYCVQVDIVPEPSTPALLIAGLGFVGLWSWRRKLTGYRNLNA